ncbi:hypothetical protein A9Z06_33620 [Rhizobium sp. YK2]|nr:hypothetical protein A9Z06_33620 [Rhizobium sp. YK2]
MHAYRQSTALAPGAGVEALGDRRCHFEDPACGVKKLLSRDDGTGAAIGPFEENNSELTFEITQAAAEH